MKKFFTATLFALALILSMPMGAPTVHAQSADDLCGGDPTCAIYGDDGVTGSTQPPTTAAANTPNSYTPGKEDAAYNWIMIKIMSLFAWLVGIAMLTLNYAVYYTVVVMGNYIHDLSAVGVTWRILRDLGNIMLIFGFLAAGIMTILNTTQYGWGKKMIPMLLVAAVFINFSLFITEAVIDTGNLFATQFYTQINGGVPPTAASIGNEGISNKIMSQLGLTKIYGDVQNNDKAQQIFQGGNPWIIGFMGILLFIVLAFVLFSLAFILIARFVILLFLIIAAPIGFAGWAIPRLEGISKDYWSTLLQQTITAPVLLLGLYIALAVITDVQFLTGFGVGQSADWLGTIRNNVVGFAPVFLSFLVAMGLLLAVVVLSKKMSAFGAGWATKTAGALSFGATAWAGRAGGGTLIGRGLLGNRFIKRGAVSDNMLLRYASRAAGFTGKRLQNRTYDIRNAPGAGAGLSKLGINAGTPSSMTAKQAQEKQYGVKPIVEWFRNASKEYEKDAKELERKGNLGTPGTAEFTRTLRRMSVDELSELRGIRKGMDAFVTALSPAKYDELQKSDKLLQPEKDALKNAWENQFKDTNTASATLARFNTEEIASLDSGILTKEGVPLALGATELDAVRRKGNLKFDDRRKIFKQIMGDEKAHVEFLKYVNADQTGARMKYWNVDNVQIQ